MKVYALSVDYDRDAFIAAVDATPMVRNWIKVSDSLIFIATYRTPAMISEHLHGVLSSHTFLVAELTQATTSGWLFKHVWDFLNDPKDSGKHPPDYGAGLAGLAGTTGSPWNSLLSGMPKPK